MIDIITKNIELISQQDYINFEKRIGFKFPESYKKHMLEYNGGRAKDSGYYFGPDEEDGVYFQYLYPISDVDEVNIEKMYLTSKDNLPPSYINIGAFYDSQIILSLDKSNYGKVFAFYSDGEYELITDSFKEFISGLKKASDL